MKTYRLIFCSSWMPDGHRIVFATDRRLGLGLTALYTVPFRP